MDTKVPSRLKRMTTWVGIGDDLSAHNISPYGIHAPDEGQAQLCIGDAITLGLSGTPTSWRHLAKVIEDAAMDLERQIAEQVHADTDPGEHYAEQAAESADGPFDGWIKLDCGHGWPGSAATRTEAQEFVDLCVATGDTARCTECDELRAITGPLVDAASLAAQSAEVGK